MTAPVVEHGVQKSVDVSIRALAAGGAGVGELPDGRVVFVHRTAPGDRARIELTKERPRWARGRLTELIEPGGNRVTPLCPVYDRCGGCQLQHLGYETQLEWKGRFVADAMERIAGIQLSDQPKVVASPNRTQYRNRVTFTLRRLRGGHVVAGFHALGRPAHVLDISTECVLPSQSILEAWKEVQAKWGRGAALLPAGGRLQLTLREGPTGVELFVRGGPRGWDAGMLAGELQRVSSIWHLPGAEGGSPTQVSSDSAGVQQATAFSQANEQAATLLREYVLEEVRAPVDRGQERRGTDRGPGRLGAGRVGTAIDAFCGTGEFGIRLAREGWRVTGIESDPFAVALARDRSVAGFEIVEGRVEDVLEELPPTDLLVVNPPRTGLPPEVIPTIRAYAPQQFIYVSCDAATLARDLSDLMVDYRLDTIRCFDLFPQTAHVETVVRLVRSHR